MDSDDTDRPRTNSLHLAPIGSIAMYVVCDGRLWIRLALLLGIAYFTTPL